MDLLINSLAFDLGPLLDVTVFNDDVGFEVIELLDLDDVTILVLIKKW